MDMQQIADTLIRFFQDPQKPELFENASKEINHALDQIETRDGKIQFWKSLRSEMEHLSIMHSIIPGHKAFFRKQHYKLYIDSSIRDLQNQSLVEDAKLFEKVLKRRLSKSEDNQKNNIKYMASCVESINYLLEMYQKDLNKGRVSPANFNKCRELANQLSTETNSNRFLILIKKIDPLIKKMSSEMDEYIAELSKRVEQQENESPQEARVGVETQKNIFRKEGAGWIVCFEGSKHFIKDLLGMKYISILLENPNISISCRKLYLPEKQLPNSLPNDQEICSNNEESVHPKLDSKARNEIKQEIEILKSQLTVAIEISDIIKQEDLKEKISELEDILKKDTNIHGTSRAFNDSIEEIRIKVTSAIERAIKKIGEQHSTLAGHLKKSIQKGKECSYKPNPKIWWITR